MFVHNKDRLLDRHSLYIINIYKTQASSEDSRALFSLNRRFERHARLDAVIPAQREDRGILLTRCTRIKTAHRTHFQACACLYVKAELIRRTPRLRNCARSQRTNRKNIDRGSVIPWQWVWTRDGWAVPYLYKQNEDTSGHRDTSIIPVMGRQIDTYS